MHLTGTQATILFHLLGALLAGGVVGLERSFHGRPAGFRTHTLVCLASSMLMLVTVYQSTWLAEDSEAFRTDPTRMAQGIMTGIGFLGAGVIFKEGLTVRGLTTAASIWMTAAIGILIGIGFYFPAVVSTALTLLTLSLFRWIEARMPAHAYAHFSIRFDRFDAMSEPQVRETLQRHRFTVANMSYRVADDGASFEYSMTVRTRDEKNTAGLADELRGLKAVRGFRISPTGD